LHVQRNSIEHKKKNSHAINTKAKLKQQQQTASSKQQTTCNRREVPTAKAFKLSFVQFQWRWLLVGLDPALFFHFLLTCLLTAVVGPLKRGGCDNSVSSKVPMAARIIKSGKQPRNVFCMETIKINFSYPKQFNTSE